MQNVDKILMNISKMPTNYSGNVDKRTGLGIIVYFLSTFWQLSEASLDADAGVGHRSSVGGGECVG